MFSHFKARIIDFLSVFHRLAALALAALSSWTALVHWAKSKGQKDTDEELTLLAGSCVALAALLTVAVYSALGHKEVPRNSALLHDKPSCGSAVVVICR